MADRALIIGIDRYKAISPLRGCVNDAQLMAGLLTESFGFSADQVKVLTDQDATKRTIRTQVTGWLLADVEPGDHRLLHVSAQGSYRIDLDRDEQEQELEPLICLADMDFARKGAYLTLSELEAWLEKAPAEAKLTVILDLSISGSGTRLLIPEAKSLRSSSFPRLILADTAARLTLPVAGRDMPSGGADLIERALDPRPEDQVIARFIEPPPEIVAAASGITSQPITLEREGFLVLWASQEDQPAAEALLGGQVQGAFTSHLVQILREAGSGVSLDCQEVLSRVSEALSASGFSQVPRLEPAESSGPLITASPINLGARAESASASAPAPEDVGAGIEGETGRMELEEVLELFREFLRTSNRLIDLIPSTVAPARTIAEAAPPALGVKQLIYVHGIGSHPRGFSDAWWEAMKPYTPSLWPGALGDNRHEAYWSDLVNRIRVQAQTSPSEELEESESEAEALAEELRAVITDRVTQQRTVAASVALAQATVEPEVEAFILATPEMQAELALPPDLELFSGIDDFVRYLANSRLREKILKRFLDEVEPLLKSGNPVEIIAHSWGTVIAYEGLRRLDDKASTIPGVVRNFFTVGSALSIPQVKSRLLPEFRDGRKPRVVRNWLNLGAEGDPIGGWLRGRPFQDDREFVNLPAVGCSKFLRLLSNPICAHSSYFEKANTLVNRDIFGRYIEAP